MKIGSASFSKHEQTSNGLKGLTSTLRWSPIGGGEARLYKVCHSQVGELGTMHFLAYFFLFKLVLSINGYYRLIFKRLIYFVYLFNNNLPYNVKRKSIFLR